MLQQPEQQQQQQQAALNRINNQRRNESGSDHVDSSEGFTSFFTTTNSGTNSGGTTNSGSPQSSDLDKKPRAVNHPKPEKESDNADESSMVVLGRVKRKNKKAPVQQMMRKPRDRALLAWRMKATTIRLIGKKTT